jgi:hypothetical protein
MTKNKKLIMVVALLVVLMGGSFYGGYLFANSKTPKGMGFGAPNGSGFRTMGEQAGIGIGSAAQRNNKVAGGMVNGEIISVDATGITVKTKEGSTRIVFLSEKSSVTKSVAVVVADLKVGDEVVVTGESNADGSVNGTTVQLRTGAVFPSTQAPTPSKN